MQEGLIVKALAGFYYVESSTGRIQCRARGIFKKKGINPLVGDKALYSMVGNQEGVLEQILPRRNELTRPPIANIDQALLVFSSSEPSWSPRLLDRMLVQAERSRLDSVIVITKIDQVQDLSPLMDDVEAYKNMGYPVLLVSTVNGVGIDQVKQALEGRISVFSGQSGVGKSTLINEIIPGIELKMGEVSHKLGRGKHTTRHVELLALEPKGYIADTPGFSQLDFTDLEPEQLSRFFREIREVSKDCYYRGCLHTEEEGCAVRIAAKEGLILKQRYDHYLEFLAELKVAKERRY